MPTVNDFTWRVGGESGEGIDSTGNIFGQALARNGVHIYTYRWFPSRIRGGLTYYEVRVSNEPVRARADGIQVCVALGQSTVDASLEDLEEGGVLVWDSDAFTPEFSSEKKILKVPVPMTSIADEHGSKIMRNMAGIGATAALLNIDRKIFYEFIEERFGSKGKRIVDMNREVIDAGYEHAKREFGEAEPLWTVEHRDLPNGRRLLINGTDATAFGALVAGCRFIAGYPITPATAIMEWFSAKVDELGGVVVQAEDELAAITMAIGANYAGTRAMTSTSGPGLSLMTEAVGLAGAAEIPVVVVDVMRPGPSTGLPTKHSQGDLMFVTNMSHDAFPRIVVSPSTTEEAFLLIQEAFNYSEMYQMPVFFLLDQDLGISAQTWEPFDIDGVAVNRGKLLTPEELAGLDGHLDRFAFTDDHVSPRAIPGMEGALFHSTGSEHDIRGFVTEDRTNRDRMMEKRMGKLDTFRQNHLDGASETAAVPPTSTTGPDDARVGILTWGSSRHPVDEALGRLERDGGPGVKRMVVTHLWPLPEEDIRAFLESVDTAVVVEASYTPQLQALVQQQLGYHDKIRSIRKTDGTPFRAAEILADLREMI